MSNYISKIQASNNSYSLGGTSLEGSFSYVTTDIPSLTRGSEQSNILIDSQSIAPDTSYTYSVADIIPDDGYDYEILLHFYTIIATSGKYSYVRLYSGSDSSTTERAWQNVGMRTARTNANYRVAQAVWVPISASDKNITVAQADDTGTTTCRAYFHGYRRIGTNNSAVFRSSYQDENLGSNSWYGVTYGNGKFIAIGNSGYISTSTDGYNWTTATQVSDLSSYTGWRRIAYSSSNMSIYVALGLNGYVSYSINDGTTWTTDTTAPLGSNSWYGLSGDSLGGFIALGSTGYLAISPNGMDWDAPSLNSNLGSHSWRGLAFGNNRMVALGLSGYVSISMDNGRTWSTSVQNSNLGSHSWNSIVFGNGKFVAIGATGYISFSVDGVYWSPAVQDTNIGSHSFYNSAFGDNKFVILGSGGYITSSNVISNINNNPVGGNIADGKWVISNNNLAYGITMSKNSIVTYSLANYLPDDDCDYMVSITGYGRTLSGSGASYYYIMPGTQTYDTVIRYGCAFMMTEYHSTSTYACSGNLMLPVYANDRNITIANNANYTTGATGFYAIAYRRMGTNE